MMHGQKNIKSLTYIRDVRYSNLGRDTDYTDFRDIPRTLHECDWLVLRSGPLLLPCRPFSVQHFVIGGSAKNNFTVPVCLCVCVCVCVCAP